MLLICLIIIVIGHFYFSFHLNMKCLQKAITVWGTYILPQSRGFISKSQEGKLNVFF